MNLQLEDNTLVGLWRYRSIKNVRPSAVDRGYVVVFYSSDDDLQGDSHTLMTGTSEEADLFLVALASAMKNGKKFASVSAMRAESERRGSEKPKTPPSGPRLTGDGPDRDQVG